MECEEIEITFPSSFRLVPATLWVTMWTECEEFVSLYEDPYSVFLKCILGSWFHYESGSNMSCHFFLIRLTFVLVCTMRLVILLQEAP